MAKKEKKSAKEKQADAKDLLKAANKAKTDYLKKHGLSRDKDYSKDKKHGPKIKELDLAIDKLSDNMDTANDKVKAKDKKKKEKAEAGRAAKYDYPPGLTAAEKKKWRVKQRSDAKKAEKGDKPSKSDKKAKAGKATDTKAKGKEKNLAPKEKETTFVKKDKKAKGKDKKKAKSKSKND